MILVVANLFMLLSFHNPVYRDVGLNIGKQAHYHHSII